MNLAIRLATVADLDEFYKDLQAAGAKLAGPPVDRPWGHRSFIVYDPDGIPIHYYCELG